MPQSLSVPQLPSGEFAHFPLRQLAPPQSLSVPHEPPRAVAHLPLRQLTPLPQSLSVPQSPPAAAHFPLRHEPTPQSLSVPQLPSGAFAHFPLRQLAPPQSLSVPQLEPSEVAHFPLRHETPGPQSLFVPQSATVLGGGPGSAATGVARKAPAPRRPRPQRASRTERARVMMSPSTERGAFVLRVGSNFLPYTRVVQRGSIISAALALVVMGCVHTVTDPVVEDPAQPLPGAATSIHRDRFGVCWRADTELRMACPSDAAALSSDDWRPKVGRLGDGTCVEEEPPRCDEGTGPCEARPDRPVTCPEPTTLAFDLKPTARLRRDVVGKCWSEVLVRCRPLDTACEAPPPRSVECPENRAQLDVDQLKRAPAGARIVRREDGTCWTHGCPAPSTPTCDLEPHGIATPEAVECPEEIVKSQFSGERP